MPRFFKDPNKPLGHLLVRVAKDMKTVATTAGQASSARIPRKAYFVTDVPPPRVDPGLENPRRGDLEG
jgi:hypothetical protein